jgi:hypothetical protein
VCALSVCVWRAGDGRTVPEGVAWCGEDGRERGEGRRQGGTVGVLRGADTRSGSVCVVGVACDPTPCSTLLTPLPALHCAYVEQVKHKCGVRSGGELDW